MASANVVEATFIFQDGPYKWTEKYAMQGAAPAVGTRLDLTTFIVPFQPLVNARQKMLANGLAVPACATQSGNVALSCGGPFLKAVRLTQVNMPRNTLYLLTTSTALYRNGVSASGFNFQSGLVEAPANPFIAIEMIVTLANGLQGKRSLAGLPVGMLCDQNWNESVGGWYKAWAAFAKILTQGGGTTKQFGALSSSYLATGATALPAASAQISSFATDADCNLEVYVDSTSTINITGYGLCGPTRWQILCYVPKKGTVNLNGKIFRGAIVPTPASGANYLLLEYSGRCPDPLIPGYITPYAGANFSTFANAELENVMDKRRGMSVAKKRARAVVRK